MPHRATTRLALVAPLLAAGAGCSIVNRIDACDPLGDAEFTVNQVAVDDQYTSGPRAAVALPRGLVALVWNSDRRVAGRNGVAPNPGVVYAGLREPDGTYRQAGSVRVGDVEVARPEGQATWNPVIATGSAVGSTVYVAWSQSPLGGRTRVLVRPLTDGLTALGASAPTSFEISDPEDSSDAMGTNATRPSIGVTPDGTRALVVYLVTRGNAVGTVRCRPLSVSFATNVHGRLEPNPIDGSDAAGSLSAAGPVGAPIIARFDGGFVVVWPDFTRGRWQATWRFLTRLGTPDEKRAVESTELGGLRAANVIPQLALDVDGDELVLAWSRASSEMPLRQDIVVQRLGRDLRPLGPERVANASAGDHNMPAVVALPRGAAMVSWDDDTRGTATTQVLARVFDRAGNALFTAESCGTDPFALPGAAPGRHAMSALVRVGGVVTGVWHDGSERAPDAFGLSVRGRAFAVGALVPALR
ncbi:MAG: hypothetical protein U0324_47140 [Polyangiales bacterium]